MPLPDLTALLQLCATQERCRGLIAFGPALRDFAPPQAELGILLLANDPELEVAALPLQDRIESPDGSHPVISLLSQSQAQFAIAAADPVEIAWFLYLSEGVVLYDADRTVMPLWDLAREWTPARLARARLMRTGELVQHLDAADRALEESDVAASLRAIIDALVTQRRLELLRAQQHPGSNFWSLELPDSMASAHYFALAGDRSITVESLHGLAEELAVALEVALEESFPTIERVLEAHPEGLPLEALHYEPLLEGVPHWDLVLWRHHRRGAVHIKADRKELPELPGHWTTELQVQLVR